MQSNCIRDASKACFNTCCVNPLLGLPAPHSSPTKSAANPAVNARHKFVSAILSSIQPNTDFTNHESIPSLQELLSILRNALPQFMDTVLADHIRAQHYYHLSLWNHVCLDYIGHGLFSYSQIQSWSPTTDAAVLSSSSSAEATSSLSAADAPFLEISYNSVNLNSYLLYGSQESEFQAAIRKRIMRYMNVFEEDYSLVFTANQSSAFKLLADSYPFQPNQTLLTIYDYENEAVETMIESAKRRGARAQSAVFSWPNFRINSRKLRKLVVQKSRLKNQGLFAFPLQSRMTGSRYSYQWMNLARDNGWHVLLDASALGAKEMETLGLSLFQPDFLICSFFKIFGQNPSGFCCLFIKKSSIQDLSQSSTSMGIISIIPSKGPFQKLAIDETQQITEETPPALQETKPFIIKQKEPSKSEIEELDEKPEATQIANKKHSTTNTSGIECRALDHADKLGLILISSRVRYLINWLVNALLSLRHPHSENGLPLVRIYGPKIKLDRGPALAFNVYDWKGERVDPILVQKLADRNNISLTCGFLKNIWFSENFQEEKDKLLENRKRFQELNPEEKKKGKQDCGVGVVSVSLGMLSNFEDVYKVWGFVSRFLDADFVEKERWRYTALNQTTVEV
ncbi:molybdenum cofactor sulfurase [Sesamum indicum]|uniref:Molybdenum cofactor sulfurase n=1 Tax=Sesamum indicum TaxID=4182 RepID=A0A6I9TJN8_SESIN|nr:molybdenum cofactor sulfurase [Sesamum indicum]